LGLDGLGLGLRGGVPSGFEDGLYNIAQCDVEITLELTSGKMKLDIRRRVPLFQIVSEPPRRETEVLVGQLARKSGKLVSLTGFYSVRVNSHRNGG
jgi:hypothetical protein